MIASDNGNLDLVRWLLSYEEDLSLKDVYGDNALIKAAKKGYFDIVEELLNKKANINSINNDNRTALMTAAENGHIRVVKLLIKKGSKMTLKDKSDKTALDIVMAKIKSLKNKKKKKTLLYHNLESIKTTLKNKMEQVPSSFKNDKMEDFSSKMNIIDLWEVSMNECEKDLNNLEKKDLNTFKKIHQLIEEIKKDPFRGIGRVERLTGDKEGWYSRRINKKDRLVYEVDGEKVILKSCEGHYK
ncbi:ankyrin repeat-containing domain protein [Neocallimastix lanati (nom. inval.)]|nr:ankyrin repeat-containing domain protein [Neocallimastix sp. JGI-2020a]